MYTLKCTLCDTPFESRQPTAKFCKNKHFKECPVCSKTIEIKSPKRPPRTCSASCNAKFELQTGEPNHACELCNKKYYSKNPRSRFCDDTHYGTCVVCEQKFEIVNNYKPASTCSKKCASLTIDREHADAKYKETVREKYAVENVSQIDAVKEKKRLKAQERYGVDNVSQATEVKAKRDKTMNDLYGGYGLASEVLGEHIRATVKKKYGVDNLFQSEEIKARSRETFMKKYGVPHWGLVGKMDSNKLTEWENLKMWLEKFKEPPTLMYVSSYFNVDYVSVLYNMERNRILRTLVDFKHSISEQEFINYLSANHPDLFYICNERDIIPPREVDFFFPDFGVAVEISPSATHHSNFSHNNNYLSHRAKDKNYHQEKYLSCIKNDIALLTFFDWMQWSDFCASFSKVINSFSLAQRRTHSHSYIDTKTGRDFLNKNHIDKVHYSDDFFIGIFDRSSNLVGVCSGKVQRSDVFEISRIVFAPEFNNVWNVKSLISFIDGSNSYSSVKIFSSNNACETSHLYESAGLHCVHIRNPTLRWVHPTKRRANGNLWSFKQFALKTYGINSVLKDFPSYNEQKHANSKEIEPLLEELGFLPVYDCGFTIWEIK